MKKDPLPRRSFLKIAATAASASVLPGISAREAAAAEVPKAKAEPSPQVMAEVSAYIGRSSQTMLPAGVIVKAKHHILDTFAAIVSGANFKVGVLSRDFVRAQGGTAEAQVAGDHFLSTAVSAAFANGNMAHADETDDSHEPSSTHPGCAIIPAALAVAERENVSGQAFLNAVVAGYDIGCRINQAMNKEELSARNMATHAIGGCFGAVAACASAMRLDDRRIRYAFDYAAQQASGTRLYVRDSEHVQKAFIFGGLPARNGTMAAVMAQAGFTGVEDIFSGESNWFRTITSNPRPELLVEGLDTHHAIMATNIKKYSVGSPIQASVEALSLLMGRHGFSSGDVRAFEVRVPSFTVVNDRLMPDINLQYCVCATLLDGGLSFKAAHDFERMRHPDILAMRQKLSLVADPSLRLPTTVRTARVTVTLNDGRVLSEHVIAVPGTAQNPMNTDQVEAKARDILVPYCGADRAEKLIEMVRGIDRLASVRELRSLLAGA